MSVPPEMTARHAATLAELAEIGMEMARELRAEAQGEAPEARARAVAAFPRVARAVRQCLALEARFVRDAARDAREEARADQPAREARRERRRLQVRLRVEGMLHDRYGGGDGDYNETLEAWLGDLKDCLHEDVLDPEVLDQPFEAALQRICDDLGLPLDAAGDEDEAPPDAPAEAAPSGERRVLRPGPDDVTYGDAPSPEPYVRYSNSS